MSLGLCECLIILPAFIGNKEGVIFQGNLCLSKVMVRSDGVESEMLIKLQFLEK